MSPQAPLACDSFSDLPCSWGPGILRSPGQVFCRMFPICNLSAVFLIIRWGLWVWGGRSQRSSALLVTSRNQMFVIVDRGPLVKVVLVRYLHSFLPFPHGPLWKEVMWAGCLRLGTSVPCLWVWALASWPPQDELPRQDWPVDWRKRAYDMA